MDLGTKSCRSILNFSSKMSAYKLFAGCLSRGAYKHMLNDESSNGRFQQSYFKTSTRTYCTVGECHIT